MTVNGKASFGGARIGDGNSVGFDFNQGISQVIDNVSLIRGKHALKTGIDAQWIGDERVRGDLFLYTFATINDYLAAKSGTNPRATRTSSSSSVTSPPATIRGSTACSSRTTGRSRRA